QRQVFFRSRYQRILRGDLECTSSNYGVKVSNTMPSKDKPRPHGESSTGDTSLTATIRRHAMSPYKIRPGTRFPPGATPSADGVNFCAFSQHATHAELLLYAAADSNAPFQVITLDREHNRSFFFWHVFVEDLPVGTYYTWRMDGPGDIVATGR